MMRPCLCTHRGLVADEGEHRTQPLDEALRELYVEHGHSKREIAAAFGVSRSAITQWLRAYGISRDERPPIESPA